MRDELLDLVLPSGLKVIIVYILDLVHQALYIFDEDIITCNKHTLLRAAATASTCGGRRTAGLHTTIRVRRRLR